MSDSGQTLCNLRTIVAQCRQCNGTVYGHMGLSQRRINDHEYENLLQLATNVLFNRISCLFYWFTAADYMLPKQRDKDQPRLNQDRLESRKNTIIRHALPIRQLNVRFSSQGRSWMEEETKEISNMYTRPDIILQVYTHKTIPRIPSSVPFLTLMRFKLAIPFLFIQLVI